MRSHKLRAAAGNSSGSAATDLASFFGVTPSASTTVRFENLDSRFDCTDTRVPDWSYFPEQTISGGDSPEGRSITMVGITDTDSLGMWAKGNTNGYSYGTNGYPTNTYICDSSSYNSAYGNFIALGNASISNDTGTTGLYTSRSIVHTHSSGSNYSQPYIDIVFSSGLGTAKGFVIQAYAPTYHPLLSSYTTNLWATQHNPLCRMTCNGVSATFAPKGYYASDSNTRVGTVWTVFAGYNLVNNPTTNAGHVAYPTQYDLTNTTDIDTYFVGLSSGTTTLPSSYFVY